MPLLTDDCLLLTITRSHDRRVRLSFPVCATLTTGRALSSAVEQARWYLVRFQPTGLRPVGRTARHTLWFRSAASGKIVFACSVRARGWADATHQLTHQRGWVETDERFLGTP